MFRNQHQPRNRSRRRARLGFLGLERLETRWMLAADSVPLDDVYTLEPDTVLEVSIGGGVLVNDDLGKDLGNPTAELVDGPAYGELTLRADGSFSYIAGEDFPGIDTFTYRLADSTAEDNVAAVTLGLAESLEDIVKFRVEVVDLNGNPVSSAPVGALLELRVFVQDVPDQENIGLLFAGYVVRNEGIAAEIETWYGNLDGYYWFRARNPAGGSELDLGSGVVCGALRRPSDLPFEPGEHLIARMVFTASEAGTLTLGAERVVDPDKYGLWPVQLGDDTAESLRDDPQFVAYGQIDYGDAVSVDFVASDNIPPVAETDIFHVGETGVLEVDAATGVLANDTDADGDTLTARIFREPRYGRVTLNANGSFRYVQDANSNHGSRLESFSYIVDDGVAARVGLAMLALPSGEPVPTSWQNPENPIDVDGDGLFTSDDEWLLVHDLETNGERELPPPTSIKGPPPYLDVNGDGFVSNADIEAMYADHVQFRLQPVNLGGSPIDQVAVGDTFAVQVLVKDLRDDPRGVFSAYLDVQYDPSLVSLEGGLEFGDIYVNGLSSDTSRPGLIDEAGAFSDSKQPLGGGEFILFTVRFTATAAGHAVFSGNPADDAPARDVGLYGHNVPVADEQTDFESGAVVVVQVSSQFQNSPNPFDTNADGHVSPLDVLFGVNRLNEKGPGRLTDDDLLINGKRCYLDVNGDSAHSPADILAVINQLNAEKSPGGEGESPAVDVGGTANARQSTFASHAMPIDAPIRTYSDRGPVVSPGTANEIEAPLNTHQENHGFRSANANDASSGQDAEVSGRTREIDRILAEGPFPNEIDLLSLPLLPEA